MMAPEDAGTFSVSDVVDWLESPFPDATSQMVVKKLGTDLIRAGVRLSRIAAFVRTLHPDTMGRRFLWKAGGEVGVWHVPYALQKTEGFTKSPVAEVVSRGEERRWRLHRDVPTPYQALEELKPEGVTDYLALPMRFLSGDVHVITYATEAEDGFTEEELASLRRVTRPLARVAEILTLARNAANLLDAYVGHSAGARILEGKVRRGETERIHCVLWFSDLRGFTRLSAGREPEETIELLNRLFDCQVPALVRHGGEVLKFMGDGLLAIFHIQEPLSAADAVKEAIVAAREAFQELDKWNVERGAVQPPVRFGVALHLGDVAYGNIGGGARLDFTCIGPAVNLASRVEGIAAKLGKRLILTEAVAKVTDAPTRCLGAFEAKGVEEPPLVYELTESWSMPPSP
jgi:adenylate cyclase